MHSSLLSRLKSKINLFTRTLFISTKHTPNPDSVIFHIGQPLSDREDSMPREFTLESPRDLASSPLARNLLSVDGITRVFYGTDFITLSKDPESDWVILKPEIFSILSQYFSSKDSVYPQNAAPNDASKFTSEESEELISMITELIDSRIRPFIQQDGGDVEFVDFRDGVVRVRLMGACVGCPSSIDTLKGGIERMLHYYIPQVTAVEEFGDDVSNEAFRSLEDKLRRGRDDKDLV